MHIRKHILAPLAIVASVAVAIPIAAQAMGSGNCDGPAHRMMMPGEMGPFDRGMSLPPFIHDLQLTEAQRDQIFKIMHDQAPVLREKAKEAQKAHIELRALTFSPNYDEAKARTLAERGAQALAAMAQMRAASLNQIYQLLSPEQRKKAEELRAEFESRAFRRQMGPRPHADEPKRRG